MKLLHEYQEKRRLAGELAGVMRAAGSTGAAPQQRVKERP